MVMTEIEPQADDFSHGSRLARGVAPTYPSDIIEMPDVSASRIPQGMGQASGLGRVAQVKASGPPVLRTSGELDTSRRKPISPGSCESGASVVELDRLARQESHGFSRREDVNTPQIHQLPNKSMKMCRKYP